LPSTLTSENNFGGEVLEKQDRRVAGTTAPPNGLYLTGVEYPENYNLPSVRRNVAFWGE